MQRRAAATAKAAAQPTAQQSQPAPATAADAAIVQHLLTTPLPQLMREAAALRDVSHPRIITFSPKVIV
jgi:hypothetical protein